MASRCIVLSHRDEDPLAASARACLEQVPALEIAVQRVPAAGEPVPDADVLVVPAEPATLQRTLDLLGRVRLESPGTSVLVLGAGFAQEDILRILTAGAYDFVSAPFLVAELVARTLRGVGLLQPRPPRNIRALLGARAEGLMGNSPAFLAHMARLPLLAGCDAGVLILGETGTGKELFAQAIHYLSARVSRPCVPINCGAIPVELIEAELFGHARGAYTTAHAAREGLIAAAEGGTLFLDEVDSLPHAAQAKLLRFLQEREYRPVGANALRRANVRVIASSNQDLAGLVAHGRFRRDLYFRLNVLTLTLSPLRERREDIPALAQHFVRRFATEFGRPVQGVTPLAMKKLLAHSWPGNVRELSHTIERAVLLGHGPSLTPAEIEIGDEEQAPLDESFRAAKARVVEQFERRYIEQMLIACDGNITHAAAAAKKHRRALWELIRKHRIDPKRFRREPAEPAADRPFNVSF
ncbi:MAG TPA: sigma-54 dependent transcriptional regulator [Burkholderiales bacterium]